ncbi:hypothetical protein HJG60_008350 [Phyllostomus discolor]|uniref:Uncharacterized protein n=1 Tax=Phyllostomus discolor TaxID=89673 RepID=A0A833Z479_9CHIR|nr:hypothetical protein HJG60_008350 [Phyllostomus discolor]
MRSLADECLSGKTDVEPSGRGFSWVRVYASPRPLPRRLTAALGPAVVTLERTVTSVFSRGAGVSSRRLGALPAVPTRRHVLQPQRPGVAPLGAWVLHTVWQPLFGLMPDEPSARLREVPLGTLLSLLTLPPAPPYSSAGVGSASVPTWDSGLSQRAHRCKEQAVGTTGRVCSAQGRCQGSPWGPCSLGSTPHLRAVGGTRGGGCRAAALEGGTRHGARQLAGPGHVASTPGPVRGQLDTGDRLPAWPPAGKGCHVLEAQEKPVTGRDPWAPGGAAPGRAALRTHAGRDPSQTRGLQMLSPEGAWPLTARGLLSPQ